MFRLNTTGVGVAFYKMYENNEITYDPTTNQKVIEIQACQFSANSPYIVNHDKVIYDEKWYVDNYDIRLLSTDWNNQYEKNINRLANDPYSRRAFIYMGSPNESLEKFPICTIGMQMILSGDNRNILNWIVNMRSNSVVKYTTDYIWQNKWFERAILDLSLKTKRYINKGEMIWHANSMHIYEEDFKYLVNTYG